MIRLTQTLSEFIVEASPPHQLDPVIAEAFGDCIGCILAGAESEVAGRVAAAYATTLGEVRVLGAQDKTSPGIAALRMAVAGHAYDFDDWEELGNTHPTVVIVPALLSVGALAPVSQRVFCDAYAIGYEVIARLGQAIGLEHYQRGFHTTATLGALGAAAATSRALALTIEETRNALSLSASQAQGYTVQFGSNAKPLQAGAAARVGVEAALLARAGATAQEKVLDDQRGLLGLLGEYNRGRIEKTLETLGAPWGLEEMGLILKPWPSCGYTHRLMSAALEVRERLQERTAKITSIKAELPDFHRAILPFDAPMNRNEALFSVPACVAQALVDGSLSLEDGDLRFWERSEVARLISLTEVIAVPAKRPELNYDPDQPDRLAVCVGSEEIEVSSQYPIGAPQNPMSREQHIQKFSSLSGLDEQTYDRLLDWHGVADITRHVKEALQ